MTNAYRDENSVPTLIASSNADGFTPVRLWADPVTHRLLVSLSGGLSILAVTGTIDDSNVTFTIASLPAVLVINGAMYQQTGGAITWSYLAGTLTLSVPVGVSGSIFGIL